MVTKQDAPSRRRYNAGEQVEQRSFSGAVRSYYAYKFALRKVYLIALQRLNAAKGLAEIPDMQKNLLRHTAKRACCAERSANLRNYLSGTLLSAPPSRLSCSWDSPLRWSASCSHP